MIIICKNYFGSGAFCGRGAFSETGACSRIYGTCFGTCLRILWNMLHRLHHKNFMASPLEDSDRGNFIIAADKNVTGNVQRHKNGKNRIYKNDHIKRGKFRRNASSNGAAT